MKRNFFTMLLLGCLLPWHQTTAHPGGNMVVVGEHVFWSYIDPIDDRDHYAAIMHWKPGETPEVIFRSEFPASDFMFTTEGENIFLIEQRFEQLEDRFMIRILEMKVGENPNVVWDWFEDKWRIGDGGFMMLSHDTIVFGRYPGVYKLTRQGTPEELFKFDEPVRKLRKTINNNLLLIGESDCWLTDLSGTVFTKWNNIINPSAEHPPLNRNMIFDADYHNGQLLLANWGNRSFDLINDNDQKNVLVSQDPPLAPHWVAFYQGNYLLFSSYIQIDGSVPQPRLIRYGPDRIQEVIWE